MFADNRIQMQVLLDVVSEYSRRWRFAVNSKKTKVVVFGGSEESDFELGSQSISVVEGYKYLGMFIRCKGRGRWKRQKESMIRKANKILGKAWCWGVRSGCMSVKSGVKAWQALVRPVLEYGAEVWEQENDCLRKECS